MGTRANALVISFIGTRHCLLEEPCYMYPILDSEIQSVQ